MKNTLNELTIIDFTNSNEHKGASRLVKGQHYDGDSVSVKVLNWDGGRKTFLFGRWEVKGRYCAEIVKNLIRRYETVGYSVEAVKHGAHAIYKTGQGWKYY